MKPYEYSDEVVGQFLGNVQDNLSLQIVRVGHILPFTFRRV